MIDWVKIAKERLGNKVNAYKKTNHTNTIEIPVYDFFVMLESLGNVCDEWCGSSEVNEIRYPVYEKYADMNEE